eukprot:8941-Heterococcus_DN1.PRE.2
MMLKHAQDCNKQVLSNILLKVNAKLGGMNAVPGAPLIDDSNSSDGEATIVFGESLLYLYSYYAALLQVSATVYTLCSAAVERYCLTRASVHHPAPGMTTSPSIAAVVASQDSYMVKYAAEVRLQEHRNDIISELKGMVKEQLMNYCKRTGRQPTRIIFLRDGVSEGQYKKVCRELKDSNR